jgi:hypothetical protein
MADLDRITELLLSDEEMPDVYYSMLENASDTEPTLDPLREMIANQQAQDDFLMTMAMLPKNAARSAINVGRQRFMLSPNEIKRTGRNFIPPLTDIGRKITGSSNIPRTAAREDFIPPLTDIGRKVSAGSPRLSKAEIERLRLKQADVVARGGRGPTYPSPQPVADPVYKQLGISDTAMNIFGGATAGVGAYATAGMIYDNLDEETKAHLRELLKIPTK